MALAMGGHMGGMMSRGSGPQGTPQVVATAEISIDIADFAYSPSNLSVVKGTKITWTNRDSAPHTATDDGDSWNTGVLRGGESATITFDTPGTFGYYCTVHPSMRGALTVRD
jgi:plastocyanin